MLLANHRCASAVAYKYALRTLSAKHVFPKSDKRSTKSAPHAKLAQHRKNGERENALRILKALSTHLWPSKETGTDHIGIKTRVGVSLSLLITAKLITIQVPFIFKALVDQLNAIDAASAAADPHTTVPVAVVLGYGVARSTASGFQELRNALFATVAQKAIRRVSRDVFMHIHKLDMHYHLMKNTGALSRTVDRGGRSIQVALSSMVFNVAPTLLEITLVSGLLAANASWLYSVVCFATIGTYSAYTIGITQWRTQFRKAMLQLENEAAGKVCKPYVAYISEYCIYHIRLLIRLVLVASRSSNVPFHHDLTAVPCHLCQFVATCK
jgi:ATP-binding cassette, subfamily B (MDR/TAP), member 7